MMNSSTSGNPSRGSSEFSTYTFDYWQYIDTLVYWGGSAGEGLIVTPSADVIDEAHINGVPVLARFSYLLMNMVVRKIGLRKCLQRMIMVKFHLQVKW